MKSGRPHFVYERLTKLSYRPIDQAATIIEAELLQCSQLAHTLWKADPTLEPCGIG